MYNDINLITSLDLFIISFFLFVLIIVNKFEYTFFFITKWAYSERTGRISSRASRPPFYCLFLRTDNVTNEGTHSSTLSYIHHFWLKRRSGQGDNGDDDNTRPVGAGKSMTQSPGKKGGGELVCKLCCRSDKKKEKPWGHTLKSIPPAWIQTNITNIKSWQFRLLWHDWLWRYTF